MVLHELQYRHTTTLLLFTHTWNMCAVWPLHSSGATAKWENVQKFGLRLTSHNWSVSYYDLVTELGIPTLERRRIVLKLCHLYKVLHKQCCFLPGLTRMHPHTIPVPPTHFAFSSHLLALHFTFIHSFLTLSLFGIPYRMNHQLLFFHFL